MARDLGKGRLKFIFPQHHHFPAPASDILLRVSFAVPRRTGKSFLLRFVAEVFAWLTGREAAWVTDSASFSPQVSGVNFLQNTGGTNSHQYVHTTLTDANESWVLVSKGKLLSVCQGCIPNQWTVELHHLTGSFLMHCVFQQLHCFFSCCYSYPKPSFPKKTTE